MNAHSFAFSPDPGEDRSRAERAPEPDPLMAALPEREWGLSAGQVAAVVAVILVVSEVIGVLF